MRTSPKYILIFLAAVFLIPLSISAKLIRPINTKPIRPAVVTENEIIPATPSELKTEDDTVYCFQTKKQHGWFAPLGIVSKEDVKHRGRSFRFTRRNSQGNWCKMECINAYGNYSPGGLGPLILKIGAAETDSTANKEWIEKIQTECIYEFISDPSGKNVIQERAYDKDMNLVHTCSRTPIGKDKNGKNRFVGSYRDFYGLPAEMREDDKERYTYGTLVMLTEDQWGNDSIVEYMDAKGIKKLNSDGVAMEIYVYDKDGRFIQQKSCDEFGNLTIDNWGNCGIIYEWNPNHSIKSATYVDDKWQPMRLPGKRNVETRDNVIKTILKYDNYFRLTEEAYYTENNVPDTNTFGIHKITFDYDDSGNIIEERYWDIENNPINNSKGYAISKAQYDENGKQTDIEWLDKDSNPNSQDEYLSRIHFEYDKDGKQCLIENFEFKEGAERLVSKEEYRPTFNYILYTDGSSSVDSLDSQKRVISTTFYDENGKLQKVGNWAKLTVSYIDSPKRCRIEECYFDENGERIENGVYRMTEVDSIKHLKRFNFFNSKGQLTNAYSQLYNDDFSICLAELDENAFGKICRAGGTTTVRHYKGACINNQKGVFTSLLGRDEFDEPDYIVSPDLVYYYQKIRYSKNGYNEFYDENNNIIDDFSEMKDSLPKIMTIEVIDTVAYQRGIRDNDVILSYGDYYVNLEDIPDYQAFRGEWALGAVFNNAREKKMTVFRIDDAKAGKYGLVEIDLPKGSPSELGFIAHDRFLTQKQKNRILESVNTSDSFTFPARENDFSEEYVVVATKDIYRVDKTTPYAENITDPTILIGTCVPYREIYWRLGDDFHPLAEIINSRHLTSPFIPYMSYYFTKDAQTITPFTLNEKLANVNVFSTKISKKRLAELDGLVKQIKQEMETLKSSLPKYSTKNMMNKWVSVEDGSAFSPEYHFSFDKSGKCDGSAMVYAFRTYDEGTALFKVEYDLTGTWTHNGGKMFKINPQSEDNVKITCINLIGADDEMVARAVNFVNSRITGHEKDWLYTLKFLDVPLGNDLYIRELTKDSLVLENGSPSGLQFIKVKNK